MYYILGLALVLRLILINQSLWLDEAIQALALMGRMGPLMTYALADFQPPLYHLLGYAWTSLAGYSEVALRTPSLLAGLGTVYYVIKIGRYMGGNKLGTIAGVLAATNPLLIYYSQEGRTYALTAFLVTASMYYYLRLLQKKSISNYILYSLFTILFIWSSYLSWYLLASLFVYTLWIKRYDIAKLQVISGLSLLLWLPSFLTSLGIGNSTRASSPEWGRVVGGLSWKSLPLTWVKFVVGRISLDDKMLYGAVVVLLGALHAYILLPLRKIKLSAPLIIWAVAPIILGVVTAMYLPVYQYFRVLFVLPAYILLLSIGLKQLPRIFTYLIVSLQLICLTFFWLSPDLHREDWRTLYRELPREAIVAMPSRAQNAPLLYYGLDKRIIEPKIDDIVGSPIYYIRYVEDLFDTSKQGQMNLQNAGYTITKQKVYPGLQLDIYENNN